jgi:ABC-2 type transport system permease protein
MNTLPMLIRREFWEHRVFLWLPLALCVAFLVTCVIVGAKFNFDSDSFSFRTNISGNAPGAFAVFTFLLPVAVTGLMAVVTFFYLSDSLYADRKDRSILFWKSLPISDAMTVLSKMLVALIVVPLVVYVLSFVTNVLAMLLFKAFTGAQIFSESLGIGEWLGANLHFLLRIFVLALWYSPIVAIQLLISVSVPRMPLVWTVVPPLALIFGERMFLGTWNVGMFVVNRLGGPGSTDERMNMVFGLHGSPSQGFNPLPMLTHVDLWAGVAVAAVLTYAAILVRRHRSDS